MLGQGFLSYKIKSEDGNQVFTVQAFLYLKYLFWPSTSVKSQVVW